MIVRKQVLSISKDISAVGIQQEPWHMPLLHADACAVVRDTAHFSQNGKVSTV